MQTALATTHLQKKAAPEADTAVRSGAPAGTPRFLRRQAAEPPREQPVIQPKLEVNEPGDVWEQEADGVASAVMRKQETAAAPPSDPPPGIQRQCTACAAAGRPCPTCAEEEEEAEPDVVQRKPATPGAAPSGSSIPVPDTGAPLSGAVRERVEPVLGADLGGVRVHSGPEARETARSLQAKAFTHQGHIWLGPGQSADDVELMAHEATHVVQQGAGKPREAVQREPDGGGSPGSGQPDAEPDERLTEFREQHAGRRHRLDEMAQEIDLSSEARRDLQGRLDGLPQQSSPETDKERAALEAEIRRANEHLEEQLTDRIALLDETLSALEEARPLYPDPAENEQEAFWALEQRRLDQERLVEVKRPLARQRIREIEEELQIAGLSEERRKELEERRKNLGEFLSSTARHRTPPGTAGQLNGKVYVVYANEVKVGGSLPWVNNNPGNVSPAKFKEQPAGAIGVNPAGTVGGFYIFSTVEAGQRASMGWIDDKPGMRLDSFLIWYSQGRLDLETDPDKLKKKQDDGEAYVGRVLGRCGLDRNRVIGSLSADEKAALHRAIQMEESGGAAGMKAGDTYTCGKSATPPEFRSMLGCDD